MTSPAIELHQVSKAYALYANPAQCLWESIPGVSSKAQIKTSLKPIDLTVLKGEVVGVVGKNGAGKSTLLQIICGTLKPSSGTLKVNGRIAALLELGAGFNPEFTGRENVYLNASILGMSKAEVDSKFNDIWRFSEIGDAIDQPVKTYSSGMFVRLAFSVAVSVEPDILVIDEALSVGDGAFARKSFDRIMALKAQGCTILFCSHSLYQVEAICDKAMWIDQGECQAFGDVQDVIAQYQSFIDKGMPSLSKNQEEVRSDVTSSDAPRLKKVTCLSDELLLSGQSDFKLRIELDLIHQSQKPSIGVVITHDSGVQVCSFSTQIDEVKLNFNQGAVDLVVSNIALLKGNYSVDVFLLCEQGIHVYEHAREVCRFRVKQPHLEVGLVHLEREWSITESL